MSGPVFVSEVADASTVLKLYKNYFHFFQLPTGASKGAGVSVGTLLDRFAPTAIEQSGQPRYRAWGWARSSYLYRSASVLFCLHPAVDICRLFTTNEKQNMKNAQLWRWFGARPGRAATYRRAATRTTLNRPSAGWRSAAPRCAATGNTLSARNCPAT